MLDGVWIIIAMVTSGSKRRESGHSVSDSESVDRCSVSEKHILSFVM